jgi:hypothetical protein
MTTLRPYVVPGFWTTLGALAKVRILTRRGFPDNLRNWRFITLTLDRTRYPDPESAYEIGKRHLRQLIYRLRRKYSIRRWCWKMEFHQPDEDGRVYCHWHLLLDYKRPIDFEELHALWGKGRVDIKGVSDSRFEYLFKYVTKAVDLLPDWVTNRTRMRLFQTSNGFFPANDQPVEEQSAEASPRPSDEEPVANTKNNQSPPETIGERLERWTRLVVSRSTNPDGSFRHRLHNMGERTWGHLLAEVCRIKFAAHLGAKSIQITSTKIETTCLRILPSLLPA